MPDSYDVIDVRREDCIDNVTLNRPGVRNAIDDHVIEELTRWAETATHDRTLRIAVLVGAGPNFCSGADLGSSASRHLFLTGEPFWARRAHELGLVHMLTPPDDLDAAVARVVGNLKTAGSRALATTKTLITSVIDLPPATVTQLTVETIADLRISTEAKEGICAFLDMRPPRWVEDDCP